MSDPMKNVKGVGKKKVEYLIQVGILVVANLVLVVEPPQGFTLKACNSLKAKLPSSIPLTAPSSIDNKKYANSYQLLCRDE